MSRCNCNIHSLTLSLCLLVIAPLCLSRSLLLPSLTLVSSPLIDFARFSLSMPCRPLHPLHFVLFVLLLQSISSALRSAEALGRWSRRRSSGCSALARATVYFLPSLANVKQVNSVSQCSDADAVIPQAQSDLATHSLVDSAKLSSRNSLCVGFLSNAPMGGRAPRPSSTPPPCPPSSRA